MGADRNQWQFPRNVAGNILGWRDDGKGMKNFDAADIGDVIGVSPRVSWYGARGDGVTNDSSAFASALADVDTLVVPHTSDGFLLESKLTIPAGKTVIFEDGAKIVFSGTFSELIEVGGDDVTIVSPIIDFTNADVPASTQGTIYLLNRSRVVIRNPRFIGGPLRRAAVILDDSNYCQITGPGEVLDIASTGVILKGTSCHDNVVTGLRFKGTTPGLHILLQDGAYRNVIALNRCDDGGAELVGVEVECHDNIIANNYAYGCEDAGYSITGYNNLVIGNTAEFCQLNGFAVFGRNNLIVGNTAYRNGWGGSGYAGFSILSNFGGIASNNFISGNFADDDSASPTQDYLAKVSGDSYAEWATSQSITSGIYRSYLDNLYIATTAGTTGATPPTHTSGTASDGAVTWQWVNSQTGGMQPRDNFVEVFGTRFKTAASVNTSSGFNRMNVGKTAASATRFTVDTIAHAAGQSVTYGDVRHVDVENVGRRYYICSSASGTTGATPLTHTSGTASDGTINWYYQGVGGEYDQATSTNRFASFRNAITLNAFGADRYIIHVNAAPEGQVTAGPGSLALRDTGTTLLGAYIKNSGTGATGWLPLMPVVSGTTANRPAASGAGYAGFSYFDTTINKPIWWNGAAWVDATGTAA